jgi:hypothetical protein
MRRSDTNLPQEKPLEGAEKGRRWDLVTWVTGGGGVSQVSDRSKGSWWDKT